MQTLFGQTPIIYRTLANECHLPENILQGNVFMKRCLKVCSKILQLKEASSHQLILVEIEGCVCLYMLVVFYNFTKIKQYKNLLIIIIIKLHESHRL